MTERPLPGDGFETINQPKIPEEECLATLIGLKEVQEVDRFQDVHQFFEIYTGSQAPEGLGTAMSTITRGSGPVEPGVFSPPDADVVATVTVRFRKQARTGETLLNLDFVNTRDGLRLFKRKWMPGEDGQQAPSYTRLLNETEVGALQTDAEALR